MPTSLSVWTTSRLISSWTVVVLLSLLEKVSRVKSRRLLLLLLRSLVTVVVDDNSRICIRFNQIEQHVQISTNARLTNNNKDLLFVLLLLAMVARHWEG